MTLRFWAVAAAVSLMCCGAQAIMPLSKWPMIMAHDAATVYLGLDGNITNGDAKTQRGSDGSRGDFASLAKCGALALDVRPFLGVDGNLVMHHNVVINVKLESAVNSSAEWWATSDRSQPVVLYMSHFMGFSAATGAGTARAATIRLLTNRSDVRILHGSEVDTVDVPSLLLEGKGLLVVLEEDMIENHDKTIVCDSWKPVFSCTGEGFQLKDEKRPWNQFWKYMARISRTLPTPGALRMHQAHWQVNIASIVKSVSTTLKMTAKSRINAKVLSALTSNEERTSNKDAILDVSTIQMLEMDDVCDSAVADIKVILDSYNSRRR
jgi:hypothetical protein